MFNKIYMLFRKASVLYTVVHCKKEEDLISAVSRLKCTDVQYRLLSKGRSPEAKDGASRCTFYEGLLKQVLPLFISICFVFSLYMFHVKHFLFINNAPKRKKNKPSLHHWTK